MKTNAPFRAWVRGTSFTLNMGKTQVVTLVAMAVAKERPIGLLHPMLRHFVVAIRGLEQRGLARRPKGYNPKKVREKQFPFEPTEAGDHVLELFKCAGIYQELRAELLSYEVIDRFDLLNYSGRRVG